MTEIENRQNKYLAQRVEEHEVGRADVNGYMEFTTDYMCHECTPNEENSIALAAPAAGGEAVARRLTTGLDTRPTTGASKEGNAAMPSSSNSKFHLVEEASALDQQARREHQGSPEGSTFRELAGRDVRGKASQGVHPRERDASRKIAGRDVRGKPSQGVYPRKRE